MRRTTKLLVHAISTLCAFVLVGTVPADAQRRGETAARIVLIKPKPLLQKEFEAGYKRHLDWHRRNNDKWAWYGWQIISGERIGYFMDGTFGHPWEDFDHPVSPAEDVADNAANVVPYADFQSLGHYVLLAQIIHNDVLERKQPSPLLEVTYFRLHPGKEDQFEGSIRKLTSVSTNAQPKHNETWYKLVSGGQMPTYVRMIPMAKLSDLQTVDLSSSCISLSALICSMISEVKSETLRYRADLSYFPQ